MTPKPSVMLSFCHPGTVRTEFMMSVIKATDKDGSPVAQICDMFSGPVLTITRCDQARVFLESPCEWLFMVDTDMVFSPKTLPALLTQADPETRPIVGGVAMTLVEGELRPSMYLVRREPTFGFSPLKEWPKDSLFRVDATGCACLLVHRSVFKKLSEHNPDDEGFWFTEMMVDRVALGEDFSFCLRCAMAEIPIFVHGGIQVGHMKPLMLGNVKP